MKSLFLYEIESTTDAAVDVAIPDPAVSGLGAEVLIRDKSDGTNPVTVTPDAGTIDGEASATVPAGGTLRLLSDGDKWMDVGGGASFDGRLEAAGGSGAGINMITGVLGSGTALVMGDSGGAGSVRAVLSANDAQLQGRTAAKVTAGISAGQEDPGKVSIQTNAADLISEYGGTGSVQMANILAIDPEVTEADAICNALLAYFKLRGTMAGDP